MRKKTPLRARRLMAPPTETKQNIVSLKITVWKFQDFTVIQILREINFYFSKNVEALKLSSLPSYGL